MPGYHYTNMKFTGCHLYHDCFTCPFPDCLESKIGTLTIRAYSKTRVAASLREQGLSTRQIARQLNCSPETISRYFRHKKKLRLLTTPFTKETP